MPRRLGLVGVLVAVTGLVGATPAAAIPGETVFAPTEAEQSYTVPANVVLLGVATIGAVGESGNYGEPLAGYLPVRGGEVLYVEVGQNGSFNGDATFGGGGAAGAYPGPCSGSCPNNVFAGSGGGASDVRTCSELAASCPGGGSSEASRLLVGGGGAGEGGQGSGPGFYCTQLPQSGRGYNQQRPLPGGNPVEGPVPIETAAGLVIPGEPANYDYGTIADVSPAQGGSTAPGAGGSLSTCQVFNGPTLKATFAPTVTGPEGSGSAGGAGASITGTGFAAPEGPNNYLPGAGGGGGGGYTGGGGGSAGYVCTYPADCYNPSQGASGGGGSSFVSNQILAPYIEGGPSPSGSVTLAPIIEIDSPTNGAVYSPGQVVDAAWSCGGASTPFQGTSCPSATDPSGSPIDTTPGTHTFTVTANVAGTNQNVTQEVTYTVTAGNTAGSPSNTGSTSTPTSAKPVIADAHLTNKAFRVGGRGKHTGKAPAGSTFEITLPAPATVTIAITHAGRGVISHGKCVAPSRKLLRKHARACTRTIKDGTLPPVSEPAGVQQIQFSGRIGGRPLGPGTYTATITASSATGTSAPVTLSFTIVA